MNYLKSSLFIILCLKFACSLELQNARIDKGLVFINEGDFVLSGDKWVIATDLNVAQYSVALEKCNEILQYLDTDLRETLMKHIASTLRQDLLKIIIKETNMLKEDSTTLSTKLENILSLFSEDKRQRRGLVNFGGHVLKFLFGSMDSKDYVRINEQMNNLVTSQKELSTLMQDQVTIIKKLKNTSEKDAADITKITLVLKEMNKQIELLTAKTNQTNNEDMLKFWSINSGFRTLEYTLKGIREDIVELNTALEVTALGKLSPIFISPKKLQNTLTHIKEKLPLDTTLIAGTSNNDMYIYYDIATVHAIANGTALRLFVEIPLKAPNRYFRLYRALELPVPSEGQDISIYIKSDYDFLAVTQDQQLYIQLQVEDMLKCTKGVVRVCPPLGAVRRAFQKSCLFALFTGDEKRVDEICKKIVTAHYLPQWNRVPNKDLWVYSVPSKENLVLTCEKGGERTQSEKIVSISGAGMISISKTCYAHGSSYVLLPHTVTESKIEDINLHIVVPDISRINNLINESTMTSDVTTMKNILDSVGRKELESGIDIETWEQKIKEYKARQNSVLQIKQEYWPYGVAIAVTFLIIIAVIYKSKCLVSKFNCLKSKSNCVPVDHVQLFPFTSPEPRPVENDPELQELENRMVRKYNRKMF